MAKTAAVETEATEPVELFDVSKTDKRSDKRVVLDYVFAARYAPELLTHFAPYEAEIEDILQTEGLEEIHTPVDTLIANLSSALEKRYTGEYADYRLRGNGASFFLPKATRSAKTPSQKAEDILSKATPEQMDALAALLRDRGLEL